MNAPLTRPKNRCRQHGFSLLEILIALMVLSIGLLGLAALQTMSLRMGHDSYQRTQATMLAYDMVDRMRANPQGLADGHYNVVMADDNPSGGDCVTSTCSTADLAAYDIRTWHSTLEEKLSDGKGTISTSGARRTITIQWRENDVPVKLEVIVQL